MSLQLPESYKSLTYTLPSTPPHLTYTPLTHPGPNDLLIKIHAAAINPVDIQMWGNPVLGFIAGKKEKGIGRDYSGSIAAVGEALKGKWEVGDEVFGLCMRGAGEGTFAEYLKVNPASDPIAKKPKCWTHEEAAAVPLVVLTAFACLDWLPGEESVGAEVQERRVVVSGASGGVGMWCVQLAKNLHNCHVTGICSSKNADFVRRMGADKIIGYTAQDVANTLLDARPNGRKYDLYIDCVGGTEIFDHWHNLLHRTAAYITIVGDKTSRTAMGGPLTYFTYPAQVLRYLKGWMFGPRYANVMLYQQSELLDQVVGLAEKGEVEVVVQEVIKGVLDEGSESWKRVWGLMEEGRVRGKIVVGIE